MFGLTVAEAQEVMEAAGYHNFWFRSAASTGDTTSKSSVVVGQVPPPGAEFEAKCVVTLFAVPPGWRA